ncbi:MAG TPA: alanine--tRNA ligase [Gaiellaceae bacterium]|nr:alanine--tRNA ligase [Gaiellaceae bacterium]
MRTTAELRAGYRAFFESKGHEFRPSASLIPRADDRSTLLVSAGMQPLMPFFLGLEEPPAPLLTTVQKVFRTPDIDEVGLDGYHLTFFEMLGNFSFGQYFKQGAIELAWEFVFEHMKVDFDRFWVSVFAGDPELGLGEDEVAVAAWEQLGLPPDRIVRLPRADNFWSVGGPGPCGPDSEMFYDWGEEVGCGRAECRPGCECERFLEFWNLVFMEFELHADGSLTPLPKQNIDTGLGLERGARILQQVPSVYDTDGYQHVMEWIAGRSGVAYGESEQATKAHRILADHGRGMTFLAADGVTPSNEGRGYVMRRVIRRAVQQAGRIGLEPPFLSGLAGVVVEQMGEAYPELVGAREQIEQVLAAEEERFGETLARGLTLFEEAAADGEIDGEEAFRLHDTYGFPLELTQELARERGLPVDEDGFRERMERQRSRSRKVAPEVEVRVSSDVRSEFVGYEKTDVLTAIIAYEDLGDGRFQAKLEQSPFYPEGGGQVSDGGYVENEETGVRAGLVAAARLPDDDQVLTFAGEGFAAGMRVRAVVPWQVRFPTMANHTATHLLHKALQDVLGEHARQAGSAVRPDKLRFDFTHPQAVTDEERAEIERRVNEAVFRNLPVRAYVVPIDEARRLGAMMLFGEKYGDQVRLVDIAGYSRELCGGTHVRATAEIGPFVILSESSVGSGTRRIEAVTSGEAYALLHGRAEEAEELRAELERVRREGPRREEKAEVTVEPRSEEEIGGVHVFVGQASGVDADSLLEESDRIKQARQPAAVVLGATEDGRVHLVANFDRSLEGRLDAVAVIREAAAEVGGGGGGRATMARAGGREPEKLGDALAKAEEALRRALA